MLFRQTAPSERCMPVKTSRERVAPMTAPAMIGENVKSQVKSAAMPWDR